MATEAELNNPPAAHHLKPGGNPRRVAVIGVHGVAHHDPGETANAMADLLLSLPPFDPKKAGAPCTERPPREFDHFDSTGLQIPLQPVCVNDVDRVTPKRNQYVPTWFRLQEGSYKFALHWAAVKIKPPRGAAGRSWSIKLLQDYYGAADSNKYVTARLEGRRVHDSTEVHVYEMFWADLARPASTVLSFLLALFQFILHVPSLSRLAIDTRPSPDRMWRFFQSLHRYASRIMQMVLPLAAVILLIVVSAAIPAVTTVQHLDILSSVVAGILIAIAGFLIMNYLLKPVFKTRTIWLSWSFLIAAAVTAGLIAHFVNEEKELEQALRAAPLQASLGYKSLEIVILTIAIWVLGAGLVWWALDAYQSTRPGIQGWGWTFYVAAAVGFGTSSYFAHGTDSQAVFWIREASFWTLQWILVILRVAWIFLALLAVLSSLAGAVAWRRAGKDATTEEEKSNEQAKARAAVRTSRFALAMPLFLFVLVTSFIWAGLFSIGRKIHDPFYDQDVLWKILPNHEKESRDATRPWLLNLNHYFEIFPVAKISEGFPADCDTKTPNCSGNTCSCSDPAHENYLRGVLAWSIGSGSYIVVLITLAGLIILIWWALPSVLTETFPPRRKIDWYSDHHTEPPRSSTNRDVMWMGAWTSRGLDSISVVTWLSWVAIFLVPLAFMYAGPFPYSHLLDDFRTYSHGITRQVVCRVIGVASTAAVLAALVRYSSPVLRVILDVDTYLRSGPIEGTPRAKIFERYVSLLRHVANYRGADGRGYDHVVIVAHSLGALISGDLLNLLQYQKNDPGLQQLGYGPTETGGKIPIRLFTMGNPLRQLLNRFFPYLYDWVREAPDNGLTPLDPPLKNAPKDFDSLLPDPSDLGVEKWVSAYRSGDYVGRSLWLDEWYKRTATCSENGIYPEPIYKVEVGNRVEFCIGAGAHTHYWDDTAPDIAEELNNLINP